MRKLKISEIYYDKFIEDPKFFGSHWDVTSRCNFRCSYCTYKNRNEAFYPYEHMLKIMEFYDYLYENYNLSLMLFGGEPLLHPDILKVVNRLGKSIYPLQIFTNLHLLIIIDISTAEGLVFHIFIIEGDVYKKII